MERQKKTYDHDAAIAEAVALMVSVVEERPPTEAMKMRLKMIDLWMGIADRMGAMQFATEVIRYGTSTVEVKVTPEKARYYRDSQTSPSELIDLEKHPEKMAVHRTPTPPENLQKRYCTNT